MRKQQNYDMIAGSLQTISHGSGSVRGEREGDYVSVCVCVCVFVCVKGECVYMGAV